jgi:hypothetical protein
MKRLLQNLKQRTLMLKSWLKDYIIFRYTLLYSYYFVFNYTRLGRKLGEKVVDLFVYSVDVLNSKHLLSSTIVVLLAFETLGLTEWVLNLCYATFEYYNSNGEISTSLANANETGVEKQLNLPEESKASTIESDVKKSDRQGFVIVIITPMVLVLILHILHSLG